MTARELGLALAALMAAAPSAASAEPPKRCPITIEFGSYCCGPDARSRQAMQDLLTSPRFRRVRTEVYGWGREGEETWCVHPAGSRSRLLAELRRIVRAAAPSRQHPAPVVRLDGAVQGTLRGPLGSR